MRAATLLLADLLLCLRFCSRLPLRGFAFEPAPHAFSAFPRAVRLLPLAGGLIGGLAAALLMMATLLGFPPPVAALFAIGAMLLATGALHEDGLADCADGFGGGTTRERKLEIMRDSAVGTYGTVALVLTLLLRLACLGHIAAESSAVAAAVIIAGSAVSRATALVPLVLLPSARGEGAGFAAGRPRPEAFTVAAGLASLFALVPVLAGAGLAQALLGMAVAAGAAYAVTTLARQHIGGHTGDVAGASQQLSEVAFYLVFARG